MNRKDELKKRLNEIKYFENVELQNLRKLECKCGYDRYQSKDWKDLFDELSNIHISSIKSIFKILKAKREYTEQLLEEIETKEKKKIEEWFVLWDSGNVTVHVDSYSVVNLIKKCSRSKPRNIIFGTKMPFILEAVQIGLSSHKYELKFLSTFTKYTDQEFYVIFPDPNEEALLYYDINKLSDLCSIQKNKYHTEPLYIIIGKRINFEVKEECETVVNFM